MKHEKRERGLEFHSIYYECFRDFHLHGSRYSHPLIAIPWFIAIIFSLAQYANFYPSLTGGITLIFRIKCGRKMKESQNIMNSLLCFTLVLIGIVSSQSKWSDSVDYRTLEIALQNGLFISPTLSCCIDERDRVKWSDPRRVRPYSDRWFSACVDKTDEVDCDSYTSLCRNPIYASTMTEYCPRTCGRCNSPSNCKFTISTWFFRRKYIEHSQTRASWWKVMNFQPARMLHRTAAR